MRRQCAIYHFTAESTRHLYEAKGYFTDFETIPNTITYLPENPFRNMLGSSSMKFNSLIYLILPGLVFIGTGIYLLPMRYPIKQLLSVSLPNASFAITDLADVCFSGTKFDSLTHSNCPTNSHRPYRFM